MNGAHLPFHLQHDISYEIVNQRPIVSHTAIHQGLTFMLDDAWICYAFDRLVVRRMT